MPDFIIRVEENEKNNILVYYGDYQIDHLYDMNDFLSNIEINFFKIQQIMKGNKKNSYKQRYVILTDIYFLLFDPLQENKDIGKLLFWGDIRQVNNAKGTIDHTSHLILEWKNQNRSTISFELIFDEKVTVTDFLDIASKRILRLRENFTIFHDELIKSNNDSKPKDYEKLVLIIKFKEDLLEQKHSSHTVKELINLYQDVIEILNERSDDSYTEYVNKIKKMLEKEDQLLNEITKTDSSLTDNDKGFLLSKSYYS